MSDCDFLDVSDYPAPEPLEMALEAIQQLQAGKFLHLHHQRYPRLLFEQLEKRGFDSDTRSGPDESCKVFIWKSGDKLAEAHALETAAGYQAWVE